MAEFA